jgi:hypothetical protein
MSVAEAKRRLAEWASRPLAAPPATNSAVRLTVAAAIAGVVIGRFAGRRTMRALLRLVLREPRVLAVVVPVVAGLLSGGGRVATGRPPANDTPVQGDGSR